MTGGSYSASVIMPVLNEGWSPARAIASIRSQASRSRLPVVLEKVMEQRPRSRLADLDLRKPDGSEEDRQP